MTLFHLGTIRKTLDSNPNKGWLDGSKASIPKNSQGKKCNEMIQYDDINATSKCIYGMLSSME